MSYDLHLFRPQPGKDLTEAALASLEDDSENASPGAKDPEGEKRKKAMSEALRKANPGLSEFKDEEEADALGEAAEEARRQWQPIELNGPDDGNGIQITLYDDTAAVTVPYWHKEQAARRVMGEIWEYLEVLQSQGGFRTYDPQIEKVLDLAADRDAVLGAYATGVGHTDDIGRRETEGAEKPSKPWWKFW
ncbi:MAG: hypothetical protein FD180_1289 [Planctomycetota bacterium]|nr:MAG: hypothetical protein FD180_1289 [Planctomycetota bacterium]